MVKTITNKELSMLDECKEIKRERDIYRQAIIDFLNSAWTEDPNETILIDALGKKRFKNKA